MLILGIETSCDETGVAILEIDKNKKLNLLSNVISSSINLHAETGGIIPENAAREQTKVIIPVIKAALNKAKKNINEIDKIAVTYGPGLIGSLLIGVETAKTISFSLDKELIPVNHMIGHIYANFINNSNEIKFPAVGLIISGGHTDLILIRNHNEIEWLGGTLDDAAGEAMDKIGRVLGLPYPGGPHIENSARKGNPKIIKLPSPLINTKDFNFSFSGLKAAAIREIEKVNISENKNVSNISASVQEAVIKVVVKKTLKAVEKYEAKSLLLGGGVSANEKLRIELNKGLTDKTKFFVPEKSLCTDNGAMIAAAAFYITEKFDWKKIDADPALYFDMA